MARNPPWTREELILALDLYFRLGRKHEGPGHPQVVELSERLNALPRPWSVHESKTFRNPSGVAMKLGNFLVHDPTYEGKGLARGNKLEVEVWDEFAADPKRLDKIASAILAGAPEASTAAPVDEDEEFPEGAVLSRVHLSRERNRKATLRKKKHVLEKTGRLECEVCAFDFVTVYGAIGQGFAECHHLVPLSELSDSRKTRLSDLAILCANCHRMIHKTRPVLGVAEFRDRIRRSGS